MPHFDLSMLLSGQYHQWLVSGFFLSIKLSVLAFVLALPLGIVVALLRMAPSAPLRAIGQAFVEAIRNVPLLAHMLFWYFGAPQLLPNAVRTWLYDLNYEAASAVIALVLYTAAYMAEDIRSGLRSIPKEQLEASRALGLSFLQAMRRGRDRAAAGQPDVEPVEELQHRHGDRRGRADVPGTAGGERHLPRL